VAGPFGVVKEQASGLYAQEMASRGFLAIAFDPSYTGESGGEVRDTADPAINSEDFSAAVDYLSCRDDVDPERIGIIGICGWGGFALNAAAMDTRIKATVTSTMYDMTRVSAYGYHDSTDEDARYGMRRQLAAARTADYASAAYSKPDMSAAAQSDEEPPQFLKDYTWPTTPPAWDARSTRAR
jgi:alpha/beta family hydrolase